MSTGHARGEHAQDRHGRAEMDVLVRCALHPGLDWREKPHGGWRADDPEDDDPMRFVPMDQRIERAKIRARSYQRESTASGSQRRRRERERRQRREQADTPGD